MVLAKEKSYTPMEYKPIIKPWYIYGQLIFINWKLIRLPRQFSGERAIFSTNGAGETSYPKANKADFLSFAIYKTQDGKKKT